MNQDEIIAAFQKIAGMARAEIDLLQDEKKEHGPLRLIETAALDAITKLRAGHR